MTIHSHTKAILLKQLGIMPLSAKHELFRLLPAVTESGTVAEADTKTATVVVAHTKHELIPSTCLTADINAILQQTALNDWQIDNLATHCRISELDLITPPLALLQRPQLKRQLWQLLTEQFHD